MKPKTTQTHFGFEPVKPRPTPGANRKHVTFEPMKSKEPKEIIKEAMEVFDYTNFYAMSSGGGDSQAVCSLLDDMGVLKRVIHINTGIGLEMTREFLKDHCQSKGWDLEIITPQHPYIYVALALNSGFPGAGAHKFVMGLLKFHALNRYYTGLKDKHACLVSGVRKFESARRNKNYDTPLSFNKGSVLLAPYFYYTNEEIQKERILRDVKISPAYKLGLGISGECMCGSYAQRNEKLWIKKHDPKLAAFIEWIEYGVKHFGSSRAQKFPHWGENASMEDLESQAELVKWFGADMDEVEARLCGEGCGPGTMRGVMDI